MSIERGKSRKDRRRETKEPESEVREVEDDRFAALSQRLIERAEELRLKRMHQHRSRNFVSLTVGLLSVLAGAAAFGWFFLMDGDLLLGVASLTAGLCVPIALNGWAEAPIRAYRNDFKDQFMPEMAGALGNLKFFANRGISSSLLPKTGILPSFDRYIAEDCFMGAYKGVKLILSESRLSSRRGKKGEYVFDGIFLLLTLPGAPFTGHTIITADMQAVKTWASTRWNKLQRVTPADEDLARLFHVFTTKPEQAQDLAGEDFLRNLAEMSALFGHAPLSVAFFGGKYLFMAIPHEEDMFEPSNIHAPVTTREHALKCKKEISQVLQIIDMLGGYGYTGRNDGESENQADSKAAGAASETGGP